MRNQTESHLSDFLCASPSFIEGAARILDFGDAMSCGAYNESSSPEAADARALSADWQAVGNDIQESIARMRDQVAAIKNSSHT